MRWRSLVLATASDPVTRRLWVSLLLAVVVAFLGATPAPASQAPSQSPQAPARDTALPRTGTARIRGRVLAADTGGPVRHAIVRINSFDGRDTHAVMTDGDGKYEFRDLPAASYSLSGSKTGFMTTQLGAKQPGDPPKLLKVGEAEVIANADIVLPRGGVIAGRVVDEFGDPVTGARVSVLRSQTVAGSRRLVTSSGSSTNDLGQYRAFGLQPGTYFVSAQASQMGSDVEVADHAGYAPTYYPGTANVGEAQAIALAAGQDATSIDIMLALVRTARISGIALNWQGRPAMGGITAMLVQPGILDGFFAASGRILPDGSFTIPNLPPGDYQLTMMLSANSGSAQATDRAPRTEYGRARVSVAGSDVTGVVIQSSLGGTVSGQVIFDGTSPPPQLKMIVTAGLQAVGFDSSMSLPGGAPATVREDGTFTMTGLFGDRVLHVSGQPATWTLKAVYLNGKDIIDTPLSFDGNERITGVQMVLTDRVTHVTATVNDESGQPAEIAYVLVFVDDPARWNAAGSRFRNGGTARDGKPFNLDRLPPGDYVAIALKSLQGIDTQDPDFLERMRKVGVKFSLREGETRDVTLKLVDPNK